MEKTTNFIPDDYSSNDLLACDDQGRFYRVDSTNSDKAVASVIKVGIGVIYYVPFGGRAR
jgi:hypothetical protein